MADVLRHYVTATGTWEEVSAITVMNYGLIVAETEPINEISDAVMITLIIDEVIEI